MLGQYSKIKQEHHILKEFHKFLREIEQYEKIKRIIPGRIRRKQSGSSDQYINFSYQTSSGLKYNMCKGSTAQELFITCSKEDREEVMKEIQEIISSCGW